jgi:Flp pilus assembly protein TadG
MLIRRLLRDKRGTAIVELALVFPILLVILFSMVIVGISINTKIAVSMAAREAARYYAVNHYDSGIESATRNLAREHLRSSVAAGEAEFNQSFDPDNDVMITESADGLYVTVRVRYHQSTIIPGLLTLIGGSGWGDAFTLSSSATFKLE